jgi:hypothetical protein
MPRARITLLDEVGADTDTVEKALVDQGLQECRRRARGDGGIEGEVVERNPARWGFRQPTSATPSAPTAACRRQTTAAGRWPWTPLANPGEGDAVSVA